VSAGYLRAIPKDPFTGSTTSWQEMTDATEGGTFDVFSGSELVGTNGTPYNRW
jgi:general secretion pathway protein G